MVPIAPKTQRDPLEVLNMLCVSHTTGTNTTGGTSTSKS
jgi:hypothetical protein